MPWYTITATLTQYYQFDVEAEDEYDAEEIAKGKNWGRPIPGADAEEIISVEKTDAYNEEE